MKPIRPEREPRWLELLESGSPRNLYDRFQYSFTRTHEIATRFCFIDYDRELALIAEVEEEGKRKIIGVGRLASDPAHEISEFAAWRRTVGRGGGSEVG